MAPLAKPRVAILGTGRMGSAAARRLAGLGFELVLWNRTREKAERLSQEIGAPVADNPPGAVERAEVALAFLADDDALFSVLATLRRMDGLVFVNMGTHTPQAVRNARNYVEGNGGCYVESPVVAGPRVVERGGAILIVAGRRACVLQASPVLEALSEHAIEVGEDPGAAQALKLSFNLLLISTVNMLAESVALAESYGVDPGRLGELLSLTVFRDVASKYLDRMRRSPEEPASFTLRLAGKDLFYAVRAGYEAGVALHGGAAIMEKYLDAAQELGAADYTRIYWHHKRGRKSGEG